MNWNSYFKAGQSEITPGIEPRALGLLDSTNTAMWYGKENHLIYSRVPKHTKSKVSC